MEGVINPGSTLSSTLHKGLGFRAFWGLYLRTLMSISEHLLSFSGSGKFWSLGDKIFKHGLREQRISSTIN